MSAACLASSEIVDSIHCDMKHLIIFKFQMVFCQLQVLNLGLLVTATAPEADFDDNGDTN